MLDYHQLEKEVFDALLKKHIQNPSFTFSVRKQNKSNAQKDYFIGTKKSFYFAFTLWDIPMKYKGASKDLLDYVYT